MNLGKPLALASALALTLALTLAGHAEAAPCVGPDIRAVNLPADGATVPTNAVVLVDETQGEVFGLVGSVSGDLVVDVGTLTVAQGAVHSLLRAPGGLPAGETVQLQIDGFAARTFVVADVVDDVAPAAPTVALTGSYSETTCSPFPTVDVSSSDDDVIGFIAVVDGDVDPVFAGSVDGFGTGPNLVVVTPNDDVHTIAVAAVDVAGNVGAATSLDVEGTPVDPVGLGCAGCGGGVPAIGLMLPLLRRRRRR